MHDLSRTVPTILAGTARASGRSGTSEIYSRPRHDAVFGGAPKHLQKIRTAGQTRSGLSAASGRSADGAFGSAALWVDHWAVEYRDGSGWLFTDPQTGRSSLTGDDFQNGVTGWNQCRGGTSKSTVYGNGVLWGWDELRGSLINDVTALNKVKVAGWYWCDRLQAEPLDRPHDELDTSPDILSRLAAAAESVEKTEECFGLYPELQPPADAVTR